MQYKKQTLLTLPLTEKQKQRLNGIARLYSDIKCPVYHYADDGRRVLIISDIIAPEDDYDGVLFSQKERTVYDKVLYHALDKCDKLELERVALVNWQAARPDVSEKNTLEDRKRSSECNRVFWSRIRYLINKFKPDSVIAAGIDPFVFMYRELLEPNKEAVQIKTRFNRVFEAELEGHKFSFTGTIDLYRSCTWDVKYKEFANLLGYLRDGLSQGIQGFNWFSIKLPKLKSVYLDTVAKFDNFYQKLLNEPIVAIDTEGSGKGRLTSKLFCMQFAFNQEKAYFLPIDHPDTPFSPKELKYVKNKLRHYFEFERAKKYHIYQYGKYDVGQLYAQLGVRFYNHRVYDTMGGAFLLNENVGLLKKYGFKKPYTPLSLGVLAAQNGCYIYEQIEFSKGDRGNIAREGLTKRFVEYSCYDATVLIAIHDCQIARAKRDRHARFLLYNCEQISDTLISLAQMEYVGTPLDRKQFYILKSKDGPVNTSIKQQLDSFKNSKAAQRVNTYLIKKRGLPATGGMFGEQHWIFDINKPETADILFYRVLKLKPLAHKKNGQGKVDKAFLKEYADKCIEVKTYKDYKAAITLRNNFVNNIYDKIHKDNDTLYDGRLRSSYTYTLTTTNRLSSTDPNLQNLTARGDWAPHLKRGFISPRRCIIVKADMSANEVRDWCNQSGDEVLRKSFYKGLKLRQELQLLLLENPDNWTAWLKYREETKWFDKDDPKKGHVSHWKTTFEKTGKNEVDQKKALINKINDPVTREIGEASLRLELEGDLHKQNCVIMYELKSTLEVDDDQRYDIKAITFGRIYGKISISYAKPKSEGGLGKTEEECEIITSNFDNTFKVGTDWLGEQHKIGEENFCVESPLGMRRHLDGYYHTRKAIINAMNRRGPNCVDEFTECLTEDGWKKYNELSVGDLIYTKNVKTGRLELQPIKKLTVSKYKGKMWKLNGAIDALVTPNHRWLVDTKYGRKKQIVPKMLDSEYIASSKNNNPIHLNADKTIKQKGNGLWSDNEVKLIGWVLTDGHYQKDRSKGIGLKQSIVGNPHKVKIIDRLLKSLMGSFFSRCGPDKTGGIGWKFARDLGEKIRTALPNKIITPEFLNSLSTKQLKLLYKHMMLGNGCLDNKTGKYVSFGAGTKEKADAFSMLCVLLGKPHQLRPIEPRIATKQYPSMPNIPVQSQTFWTVYLKARSRMQPMFNNSWVKYKGKVWCPTVDNGTFIARRNNSVYVTGNSMIQGTSSNIGICAIRSMQKLFWHFWVKHEKNVYWRSVTNYVHDAIEGLSPITFLPVYLYMLMHSMTTLVHRRFTKTFGYNFRVGLEGEVNLGAALSECKDVWLFDRDTMMKMIKKCIEFHNKELGYHYKDKEVKEMIEVAEHNWKIVSKLRLHELKTSVQSEAAITAMYLNESNARKIGLIVESHDGKLEKLGDESYLDQLIENGELV